MILRNNKYCLAALVYLIVPLSGVSIDIYVPSLPDVSGYFHTTAQLAQYSITAYLIGLGVMQLVAGGISDSFGRRNPFMCAMGIYIVVTFLMCYSRSIYELISLRALQGASLALVVVPMRSVIADIFEGVELQKMMTYSTISWSLGPIMAPFLGGFLQSHFGWKANFYFLGGYSLLLFLYSMVVFSETIKHKTDFRLENTLRQYKNMILNDKFLNNILIGGLLFAIIYLFGISGPFFIESVLDRTAKEFGFYSLLLGLGWFLGAMTNRFILTVSLDVKAVWIYRFMFVVSLAMLLVSIALPLTIYTLIVPMLFLFFSCGILYPSYFMECVFLFKSASASANALFNSSAFLVAGCVSVLGSFLKLHTQLPFSLVIFVIVLLCTFLSFFTQWRNYARDSVENASTRN